MGNYRLDWSKTMDQTKKGVIIGAGIDQIRGQIKKNWKFNGQLRVQVYKWETKN
jgi:hypothetical protein